MVTLKGNAYKSVLVCACDAKREAGNYVYPKKCKSYIYTTCKGKCAGKLRERGQLRGKYRIKVIYTVIWERTLCVKLYIESFQLMFHGLVIQLWLKAFVACKTP